VVSKGKHINLLWFLRMLLVGLIFSVTSVLLFPVALVQFGNPATNRLFLSFTARLSRYGLGLKVGVRRNSTSSEGSPCVFVMNHQAAMDILLNVEVYPKQCVVVAKRILAFVPFFGWLIWAAGNLLLDRKNQSQSLEKMELANRAIQKKSFSVWLFPEGTRSGNRGLGPFKKGAFYMAIKNQVAIVPVVVSSYVGKMDFARWHSGTVLVKVLSPISTIGLGLEDVHSLLDQVHREMKQAIADLDEEVARSLKSEV
jgi:1-acyl-sn-glycerol-3-phosphate acyltransferase